MTTEGRPGANLIRADVDQLTGSVMLEFGATWCGHCQALRPHLLQLRTEFPQVEHIWIEDGKGKPLGRSFAVKLWPTLILLRDGRVVRRLVRPTAGELEEGLKALVAEADNPL